MGEPLDVEALCKILSVPPPPFIAGYQAAGQVDELAAELIAMKLSACRRLRAILDGDAPAATPNPAPTPAPAPAAFDFSEPSPPPGWGPAAQ